VGAKEAVSKAAIAELVQLARPCVESMRAVQLCASPFLAAFLVLFFFFLEDFLAVKKKQKTNCVDERRARVKGGAIR